MKRRQTVTLFRAIDETSTTKVGNAIFQSLLKTHQNRFEWKLFTVPRYRPFQPWMSRLLGAPNRHVALNSYFARLGYYPLASLTRRSDVYHITDEYYGGLLLTLDRSRSVVTFNHHAPDILAQYYEAGGYFLKVQRFVFERVRHAAYIVTASDYMRHHLIDAYHVPAQRIVRNYYGIDANFHPRPNVDRRLLRIHFGLPPDVFALIHVGSCGPAKNVETILRALARLPHNVHLVQVGGYFGASHLRLIDQAGLAERVHALGTQLSDDDLAELYSICDALVFPSIFEGFGLPVVEAMASGLPPIIGDTPVLREIGGKGALLVAPTDDEHMAAFVATLVNDAGFYAQAREAALQRAADFSWKLHAETLCDIYADVADRHAST